MYLNHHNYGFMYFILILAFLSTCRAEEKVSELTEEEKIVVEKWKEMFERVRKAIGSGIKMVMPYFMSSVYDDNLHISQECKRGLFQWISDIKATKPWALKLLDASAKIIEGLLSGTFSAFGSFDQCIDTANPKGTLRGKYCTIESRPLMPPKPRFYATNQRLRAFKQFENDTGMIGEFTKYIQLFYLFPLRLGLCIPSACSTQDVGAIASSVSEQFFSLNITVPHCEVLEETKIEGYQIPMLCVIAILAALLISGTLYNLIVYRRLDQSKDNGIMSDCLMAFSATENWNKLMNLKTGAKDLSVLHGIRFFTMCWIILGHTYYHLNFNVLKHQLISIHLTTQFLFSAVSNASFTVDTFFFMSGLLIIYVTKDVIKSTGKTPSVVELILHRYYRFLPIQMFFVGCSTLLPLFGSGPVWHENMDPVVEGCKKDWWANIIFINNLYRSTDRGCLSYSWYLSADFQVYLFCIPIVILFIRKPRVALWANFTIMLLSMVAIAVHNYIRELPPAVLFTRADLEQRNLLIRETFYTPLYHLAPYCIGMFAGYYLHVGSPPIKMHWSLHLAAWISTFAVTTVVLFGVHPWNRGYDEPGVVPTVLYASLSRMAWTLGLAWITIACMKGYGGWLSKFLRYKLFVPLSRLTFLVYMVHPLVQYVYYAVLRDGIQAKNHLAIFSCFGFIVTSYGIALILSIFLESPFISLGKIIFKRRGSSNRKKRNQSFETGRPVNSHGENKNADWKFGPIPRLMNGYGKSNDGFQPHENGLVVSENSKAIEEISSKRGDFICHL